MTPQASGSSDGDYEDSEEERIPLAQKKPRTYTHYSSESATYVCWGLQIEFGAFLVLRKCNINSPQTTVISENCTPRLVYLF